MSKKIENRFVDVFNTQIVDDVKLTKNIKNKAVKLTPDVIHKLLKEGEKNILITEPCVRGEYEYNNYTRGTKTKNKCSVCDAVIEKIYRKKLDSMTLKYIWEEKYDRCSKCYIVYGFLGVK